MIFKFISKLTTNIIATKSVCKLLKIYLLIFSNYYLSLSIFFINPKGIRHWQQNYNSPDLNPSLSNYQGKTLTTRPDKFFGYIIIFIILIHINIIYTY